MKIAFPVEVKMRDLRSAVWLSLHLLNRKHEIVLGETASIRQGLDIIEPDVYIRPGLSQNESKVRNTRILQDAGGHVVVLQTEGGVFSSDQWYRENQIQIEMLRHTDVHCAWGEQQAAMIYEATDEEIAEILVSGHPRFDLLVDELREVYRDQADSYIKEYGDYVLVNTNFAFANHAVHSRSEFDGERVAYQSSLIDEYTDATRKLASDLETNVVVRPHPMEDLTTYRERLSGIPEISIIREGNVRPWILGADAVVHKSSTSGIESALLNTPVYSFRPVMNNDYDAKLPIAVSEEAESYDALCDGLSTRPDVYSLTPSQQEQLQSYFYNANNPVATEMIAEKIDALPEPDSVELHELIPSREQRLRRLGIRLFGADLVETLGETLFGTDRANVRQKVPGISSSDLRAEIETLRGHLNFEPPEIVIENVTSLPNTFMMEHQ